MTLHEVMLAGRNKLREAGSETIVAEMQKQFDEFKKGQE